MPCFLYTQNAYFKIKPEAEEITQWLSAFAALKEDLSTILIYNMAAYNLFNSSSRESSAHFWTPWVPGIHVLKKHT